MADDPNPALRAELMAALAVVTPQIRGLIDLRATPNDPNLLHAETTQITDRQRRASLIQNVINDLDQVVVDLNALEADGYPSLPPVVLPATLYAELQSEMADLAAAAATFTELTVTAGPMTLTENPEPPTAAGP